MPANKMLILGGGTAGWMTANVLKHQLKNLNIDITLVESPNIGSIGVGEGSTPHLKRFFDLLGISETEWMPACHATFKNGISFINWTEHLPENRYFHPFPSIIDRQTASAFLNNCMARHQGKSVNINPDNYFLAYYLSEAGLSPKTQANKPIIPMNYAYHFDATLVGKFLNDIGVKMGVNHVQGEYVKTHFTPNNTGEICAIELKDGRILEADFFIDASGFSSHLLQQSLKIEFESFTNNLFNDSAIAMQTKVCDILPPETKATALKHGWAWHIPLTNRTGNGYVFSSKHTSFENAEQELREHIGAESEHAKARHIKMKVGQVKQAWHKNVMAIGLAQGFIEPLEATALHLVMETLGLFLHGFKNGKYDDRDITQFNLGISERYQGIRDYIVCHYKVNSRSDTAYWRECSAMSNISDNLQAVLSAWQAGKDITPILNERKMTHYYPAMSWYCLLAGYGYFANEAKGPMVNTHQFARMRQYIERTAAQFESHASQLGISKE